MGDKRDWSVYSKHGVPVKEFFLFSHAARVFSSVHGVDPKTVDPIAMTEQLCEQWLQYNPSSEVRHALHKIMESAKAEEPPKSEPRGAMAPPLQQAPALCGHQSDPDPNGTRHTCHIPGKHIGVHEDQEWSWFPTDWKPTRKTL